MSKAFRTIAPAASTGGRKLGFGTILMIAVAVAMLAVLVTHGVHAALGIPLALGVALAVDRLLFGAWK